MNLPSLFTKNTLSRFAVIAVLLSSLTLMIHAQPSKIVQGGIIAGIPYASTDFENINLTNGAVNLNFPLASLQGRGGVSFGYQLTYSSKLWQTITNPVYNPNYEPDPTYQNYLTQNPDSGWQDNSSYSIALSDRLAGMDYFPSMGCLNEQIWQSVYRWKVEVVAPAGRKIEFRPAGYSDTVGGLGTSPRGYFNVKPDGTSYDVATCTIITIPPSGNRMTYYSIDGSGIRLTFANNENLGFIWEMSMPDGSRIISKVGGGQKIIDKNGNFIETATITLPDSSQTSGWIDEVGRWIAKKTISSTEDHYYQKGFDGQLLVWRVFWKNIYVKKEFTTTCAIGCPSGQRGPVIDVELDESLRVVERIETPIEFSGSEHAEYSFLYYAKDQDDANISPGWGEIKSVTIPTNAVVKYGYGLVGIDPEDDIQEPLLGEFHLRADQVLNWSGKITRKVLEYEEEYDGLTDDRQLEWTYDISDFQNIVINPDGSESKQYYHSITSSYSRGGQVFKEIKPDGTIIERLWDNNYPVGITFGTGYHTNAIVKTEVITIPDASGTPALSMIKDYNYDQNGNVLSTTEYDWIPASSSAIQRTDGLVTGFTGLTPARSTTTSYYNATPAYTSMSSSSNAYYFSTAPLFRNLAGVSDVRNSSDVPVSRTETYYDGSTSLSSSPTAGNPTMTRAWDSTKGSISSPLTDGNSIKTQATYNAYGMPLTTTDANGNLTTITYGNVTCPVGTVTGLYPTHTVAADGTAIERTSSAIFDCYSGLATSVTDEDNDVTVVTEYDYLGRPVKVRNAYGTALESWTTSEYDDELLRVIIRSDLNTEGDGQKVAIQHFDQLGRVRLARTLEVPGAESPYNEEHGIKVQTRYLTTYSSPDGFTYQLTSNPYRGATSDAATSEETMGWTRSKAWHTGKKSEVETFSGTALPAPWGSNSNTTGKVVSEIDANASTVTDQAGKQRRSISNALGQLIRIDEPDGTGDLGSVSSPEQPTHYYYNTLGKMVRVNQGAQNRYFMHDSLGRLLRVRQPEQEVNTNLNTSGNPDNNSWTIGFTYDNNGNLLTSRDANNVLITSTYDDLNRQLTRSYSDSTPSVSYEYDDDLVPLSHGKLTKVTSSVSEMRYTEYDEMGRLVTSEQRTDGEIYPSEYKYNLAGMLVEQTYPSGRVVKNVLDNVGNISIIQSKRNENFGYWNYAEHFNYTASNVIKHLRLGNWRWESAVMNSRNQVLELRMGNSATDASLMHLKYEYGEFDMNGNVDITKNAGNIARQTISFNGLADPFVQEYKYDSLDRITEAKETVNSTQTWIQQFGYDRYGNRTSHSETVHGLAKLINEVTLPAVDASTNRFSSTNDYEYDAVGNLIQDIHGRQFTFNGDNKQTEVKDEYNSTIGEYVYDGNGKRIKKITATEYLIFVYDGLGKLIGEYSTDGPPQNPMVHYTATDPLGSPRVLTNELGEIVSRRDFMPFGEEIVADQTYRLSTDNYGVGDNVRQMFTGYERDEETGLDFAEARYYYNNHGRFTAVDPLLASGNSENPQTFNRYAYTMNRPLILADPSGLQAGAIFCSKCSEREQAFIDEHPIAAAQIGQHGMENNNISSIVLRITNNIGLSSKTPLGTEDGSQRNAFRHAFLGALITLELGPDIAKKATDSHEVSGSVDLGKLPTRDAALVDQVVDLENNAIGIELGKKGKDAGATAKSTAISVLTTFRDEGLFTATQNKDGTFTIEKSKITQQEYDYAVTEIQRRDEQGFSPEYRKTQLERMNRERFKVYE